MWTVVYICSGRTLAEQIKQLLSSEGLLVSLRSVGAPLMSETGSYEVMVPELEAEEAHEIINNSQLFV